MIFDSQLDGNDDELDDEVDDLDDVIELDDGDDEWQGGLRRLGLVGGRHGGGEVVAAGSTVVPFDQLMDPDRLGAVPGAIKLARIRDFALSRPGLPDSARQRMEHAWSAETFARYERDWDQFDLAMRAVRGLPHSLAATDVDVVAYLESLAANGYAMNTIKLRRASIDFGFRLLQMWPPTRSPLVETHLAGVAVDLGTAVAQKAPLLLEEMRTIVRTLPFARPEHLDASMRRDQLLVALGWASALRPSTLVALDAEDLVFEGRPADGIGGMHVRIRRHKGDRTAAGAWLAIPWASDWTACPARLAYTFTRDPRHRRGPLFRRIDKGGIARDRLDRDMVSRLIKPMVSEYLHLDADPYSATSLRAGFVTDASRNGVPLDRIQAHTRHAEPGRRRTSTVDIYRRSIDPARPPIDPWPSCALAGGWY